MFLLQAKYYYFSWLGVGKVITLFFYFFYLISNDLSGEQLLPLYDLVLH